MSRMPIWPVGRAVRLIMARAAPAAAAASRAWHSIVTAASSSLSQRAAARITGCPQENATAFWNAYRRWRVSGGYDCAITRTASVYVRTCPGAPGRPPAGRSPIPGTGPAGPGRLCNSGRSRPPRRGRPWLATGKKPGAAADGLRGSTAPPAIRRTRQPVTSPALTMFRPCPTCPPGAG